MLARQDDRDKWSHLSIGTATDRIDLLDRFGFMAHDWIPVASPIDDYFGESTLGDFRQLLNYRDLTTVDSIPLWVLRPRPNGSIASTRALRVMLRRARNYWRDRHNGDPVYLEARRESEAESRFAVVMTGRAPNDSDPYGELMSARAGAAVMDAVALEIEHLPWQSAAPDVDECVSLSSLQSWPSETFSLTRAVSQSSDDAAVKLNSASISLVATETVVPWDAFNAPNDWTAGGIRFQNITIPAGSTILGAYITFNATRNLSAADVYLLIHAEKIANPATYTADFAIFLERLNAQTDSIINWPAPGSGGMPAWTAGGFYQTEDLTPIVQELIDQSGWASGNAMNFFVYPSPATTQNGRAYATWDSIDRTEPRLTIYYQTAAGSGERGQEETCAEEARISNKHVISQLTNGYRYDASAGTWQTILPAAGFPTGIMTAPVQNGDRVIIGTDTSFPNSGPFDNIVWALSLRFFYNVLNGSTIDATYWNGAAWAALTITDNTGTAIGAPWTKTGVNSMHWIPPTDWAVGNLQTIFGGAAPNIDGYWVSFTVTLVGGDTITPGSQSYRQIYTANRGCVDVDSDVVTGDLPALALMKLRNQSDQLGIGSPELWSNRVLLGLRSVDRGESFRAYVNISDEQNPSGVTVINKPLGTNYSTSWINRTVAPSGRCLQYLSTGAHAEDQICTVHLTGDLPEEYIGDFHAFLRIYQTTATTQRIKMRLNWWSCGQLWQSEQRQIDVSIVDWHVLDFGRVSLPAGPLDVNDQIDLVTFGITAESTAAATVYLYDLILVPVDEWAGDFRHEYLGWEGILGAELYDHNVLWIDGRVAVPKYAIRAVVYDRDLQTAAWTPRAAAGPALHADERAMRIWSFQIQRNPIDEDGIEDWIAPPALNTSPIFRMNRRFASQRGDDS